MTGVYRPGWRAYGLLALIAALVGGIVAARVVGPTYTDAYYYFNAGQRLATGLGLTDPYIALTYLGAPESLPAPSHTYWMPLPSLLVALMGGSFRGTQVLLVGMWVGLALLAFWLGARLGGTRRHAWGAGLLAVACAYYPAFLVTTDTFTPFGLVGALCLLAIGLGYQRGDWRTFGVAGVLAGLAHLTRADGLLLAGMVALFALLPGKLSRAQRLRCLLAGLLAYGLVMLPWLVRNLTQTGSPLPVGGTATIWLRGYDEIVSYPPQMSLGSFLEWGVGNILASRWEALTNNLGTFVAVEGLIVLAPLIVIALVKRGRHPWLLPVWVYALALHLAMTFIFAYPGYRGGLFHSATALLPWWMALGLLGLDDVIDWIAARRRSWRPGQAKVIFTLGVLMIAVLLTFALTRARLANQPSGGTLIRLAEEVLPADAVVMSNDPAALYYYTGLPGIVVPDAEPGALLFLLARYRITHILLDENRTAALDPVYEGLALPAFLELVPQDVAPNVRVFEVTRYEF